MGRIEKLFAVGVSVLGLAACGDRPLTSASPATLAVFHTKSAVRIASLSGANESEVRTRVREQFPAACLDADDDSDGVPDSLDEDAPTTTPTTTVAQKESEPGDDHGGDGGVDDGEGHDEGDDHSDGGEAEEEHHGDDDDAVRCQRCNRGPGTAGEFRLEIRDAQARLGRGTVFARTGDVLTVSAPNGFINVTINAETDVRDGEPAPGAEIEVRGTVQEAAGETLSILADEVRVLCPSPGVVPDESVPGDAQEVPGAGGDDHPTGHEADGGVETPPSETPAAN